MKEKYENTIFEIIEFHTEDVIVTSNPDVPDEEYQLPVR